MGPLISAQLAWGGSIVISRRQAVIATVPPDETQISNQEQQQFHTFAPLERGEKGRGSRYGPTNPS